MIDSLLRKASMFSRSRHKNALLTAQLTAQQLVLSTEQALS
jgi:hypothetical protein